MNELELLKQENASLITFIDDLQSSIAKAELNLNEINAELADDVEEIAGYQAMLRLSNLGLDKPVQSAEENPQGNDVIMPRQDLINQQRQAWKKQFNAPKDLK